MRRFLSLNSLNVAGFLVAAIALQAGLAGRAAAVSFTSVAYPGAVETDPSDLSL